MFMRKKLLLGGLFLLFCLTQLAAQRTVTGSVTSQDGTPLSNASVIVVGQKSGGTTAANGAFSIKVPPSARQLSISYLGYETRQISIEGQTTVSVKLQQSTTNLNEVIVTGYSSQKKKDITGSV